MAVGNRCSEFDLREAFWCTGTTNDTSNEVHAAGFRGVGRRQVGHGDRRSAVHLATEPRGFFVGILQVLLADDDLAVFQAAEAEIVRVLHLGFGICRRPGDVTTNIRTGKSHTRQHGGQCESENSYGL